MADVKPVFEVIACVANCGGHFKFGVEFTFDLRDNRTGHIYTSLIGIKLQGEWHLWSLWPERLPSKELDRWSRNLFALAEEESLFDNGLYDYETLMEEFEEERIEAG